MLLLLVKTMSELYGRGDPKKKRMKSVEKTFAIGNTDKWYNLFKLSNS